MAETNNTTETRPTPETQFRSIADLYARTQPFPAGQPQTIVSQQQPDLVLYLLIGIVIFLLVRRK